MFDEQDRQYFYNEFKNNGYEVGSYDDFKKDLNNKEDRDWYYNEAKNMGYDVGTQADFDKMVLEPAPSTSGGGKQVVASAHASTEAKPQVAQPVAKPKTEYPQEVLDAYNSPDNKPGNFKDLAQLNDEYQRGLLNKPGIISQALGMMPKVDAGNIGKEQKVGGMIANMLLGENDQQQQAQQPQNNNQQVQQPAQKEASPESKEETPVTTPTGVVNNEGLMDAKFANYLENWKQRPDKQGGYFENMVADLLADGTANSNEEAVQMVQSALGRYANRSAMDVTNQVVASLPDDTVQDAEKSIEAQWYSHGVQDKLKQEADSMGISYDDYVAQFLKPAMVQSLVQKYGQNYRDIAEGIATRLYAHDEHVQDRLMNQDINEALSSVINKYVNPSVVEEYNKAQEAGSKAFTEGMEGSQYIPANLRLGTALGAQYEANEAKDPAKVLSGLQKKFGNLYRNPEFLNDMSNAAFKVMQQYGLNGGMSSDPKQFKPMINSVLKNELDQLEIKGMMPKGSAEYIMKTGLGNTIVGKITRKAMQTDYQNWLEDIANQQYQPGFWERVGSGALTFAGDAWSYWLPGAAGGKVTKSMLAKAEGRLASDLMAKGMEAKMAERAAKVLIGKSKGMALKTGAAHGAVTFGGQSAISKPIDEIYRTGQFDENGKVYNPSVGKILANTLGEVVKQSAVGAIMQGGTIANMVGKGRGLATNILADVGGKVVDSSIMTGQQMLERMAQDPSFKPTGKDAAESFLESMANLTSIGLPGMVGKYARFKDAKEFNRKFDFNDQDIAELKRFGYDDLRDAFEKLGINGYRAEGDGVQMMGQLTQKYMDLMNDKSVPEVLKAKMMAVVEGKRPSSFSPVVDSIIVQPMDNDGKVYLETLNKDGGIIDRKEYSSLDEAQKADKKLDFEKSLNITSEYEKGYHTDALQDRLNTVYEQARDKYAAGEQLNDEDKAAIYLHQNASAIGDIMQKQQKGMELTEQEQQMVNSYRHFYDSAFENSPIMKEYVRTFEDSQGVEHGTLRKALEGDGKSRTADQQKLVEEYQKQLYNDIVLKREMNDAKVQMSQTLIEGQRELPGATQEGGASAENAEATAEKPVDASVSSDVPPTEPPTPPVGGETPSNVEGTPSVENGSSPSDATTASNESKSDAYVMGQNAYQNGDAEGLKAIDHNDDVSKARLKRAFADDEAQMNVVVKAYEDGKDMEQFLAQRSGYMTPAQQDAVRKYVEAQDAKNGVYDALQHADDGYGEALKEQLWPYQTEDGNIVPATLTTGQQVFLKKANEYGGGFVVVPDEQGQPTIKQVSSADIKEVGTPIPMDDYINQKFAEQVDARYKQFFAQYDGSGLKPSDTVEVAMEAGDEPMEMTFAGYSEDGKIVLSDGKDNIALSKDEFNACRQNALDASIGAELDAEDAQRANDDAAKAEADKQERYKKGIFGYAAGQPDYSDTQTDPKVAAEYLQETAGEDRKALFANIVAEKQALQKRINQLREHIASNEEWLSINADLDPKNAETRTLANKQMEGQIADLEARFDNWNKIRSAVMTPDEAQAIKADRTQKIADAGVNEGDVAPIEGREVAVLSDEELKKQYPTMDEASDFIASERKRIYRIQSDEVQREIDGVDKVLDRYVNGEIDLEPEQIKELNTTKAQLEARQANLTESAKELKAQADKLKPLYRKENMEARAKVVENLTPAEQRAIKVENAIKNGNMSQLNAIYDEVRGAIDFNDNEPNTLEEYIANSIGRFTLNYEGKEKGGAFSNGIQQETGLERKDFDKLQILAKDGEGKTVPEFVHSLYDDMPKNLKQMGYTDQDIRSAFLDLIGSAQSYADIKNYTLNNKVAHVEQLMRDFERQEEEMMQDGESAKNIEDAPFADRLKNAIAETETEPTEAQKKAGNYKKGHLSFGGYDFTVETPKGVTRSGKDEQGKPWSVTMHDTYGYILGKIGVDGDHIDMFINDAADLDSFDGNVYVVDQVNPETGEFDEHKVMYGYPSEEAATEAYLANYSKDWKGLGKVTAVPKATFDKWLESSDRKTKPFADYAMVQHEEAKKAKEGNEALPFDAPMNMDDLPFHRDVKEVKPSEMTEAQKVAYDAVSTMLKKAGIPVKVVSNEDMEKVAEAQDNLNLAMLLNHSEMRFKIKTPEEKQAAENAYNFAKELRPDKWKQYAVVDMSNPNKMPEYFEKQELARKERSYYNKLMWGNYKVFNLDKSFEDNVAGLTGSFPSEFDPYKIDAQTSKKNELKKQIKETEEAYKLTGQERKEYQNQLMKEYMDEHGLASGNDIPDDVWREFDYKAVEKYQDKLDSLFAKYKDLDRQLKAVAEPGVQYLKGKGVVYGYTDGKEIVLNQEHLNANTPIHEYQHLWRTAAKEMNPELIEHGDKLIMQTQLFADLKEDPNYKHLSDDEICDEAFARLTGEDGAAILEQMANDAIKENPLDTAKELTIINRLKNWLKKFWYWTLDTFTKWKPEDIKKMTLEDIRNLVLRDLANGVDPRNLKSRLAKKDAVEVTPEIANTPVNIVNAEAKHGFKNYAEAREWAKKNIVRTYNNEETGGKGEINISNTAVGKYLSEKAVKKTANKDVHMSVLKVLPSVLRESIDAIQHVDRNKVGNDRSEDFGINPDVMIHRCYGAVNIGGKVYGVKITLKENVRTHEKTKLYSYEATKIELLDGQSGDVAMTSPRNSNNSITVAKIIKGFETTKENGKKFSLEDPKTLAGVHNISEEKLLKAIKQGGLANPSVAVIDTSKQNHESYGDISLILPSDKVAKRTGKNAGTWQGDAWTPTYPQVEKQISNKGSVQVNKDVLSVPKEMQHEARNGIDRWILDGNDSNSGLKYLFLHEKGVAPKMVELQHKYSDKVYNGLKSITSGNFDISSIGKADTQKVLDMYIDNVFGGDRAAYEEKQEYRITRYKKQVAEGEKNPFLLVRAKNALEQYDKYGFYFDKVQEFVRKVERDHRMTGVDTDATLNEVEDYIKNNNLTDEFNTWLEGKEKEYGIKEVIFDGFTPSGNRRYVPNTLENVSKIMKKQGRNGATGSAVSFQNFAARLMPSYGTLKDIRSKKGLLTSDREEFDKFRDKWSGVFYELGMKCQPDATGTFEFYGLERLSEAAMTSDPQAYLKKEYNVDFSDEDTKRLKEMVKAIKEEQPAMYFETKFERPVSFDEFSSAVVPSTASNEVKQALQNAGVQIYEYDPNKEGDRKRAFNEAINSNNEIRFHRVTEPEELDRLNKEKTFRMYSGMQELDGKLYSPMAAIIDGKRTDATEIGAWMRADERPDLVKNGKFQLVKTDKKPGAGEGPVPAAYNPYMHTSTSVMNDQFSGAYARGNIKVVEWEIPESEKTSGYHAEGAKDSVGLVPWTSGTVNSLLPKDRQRSVMLSRWRKAVRIVPDEEVAEKIAEQLSGTGLAIPWNVVTPNQLRELAKLGVPITTMEQGIQNPEVKEQFLNQMVELKKEFPQAQFVDVKMTKEAFKEWGGKGIVKSPVLEQKLKKHPDSLMKAGTYFSGGGLVEEGLKGIIDPVVAVEYDRKISGVYRNNFGQHIVTADVRDVDPKELVKHIDGEVEYFHASPVCKNYSQAKSNGGEVELDKETAKSTADFIDAVKPRVVTIENVKGYKDSEAMKIITQALDKNGYKWDADVYNAADFGGYTSRERLIVRAVKDGELPEKPKKQPRKGGWLEAVEDILPTLTEKKSGVAPWMDARLKVDGIDWQKVEKPLYVMGSAYADGKIPHAYGDEILPTLRTKSGDVIIMPGGKVLRADGRVLARITGLGDDYLLPKTESLAHTIIGNGIPVQLTKGVIAPLLNKDDLSGRNVLARLGSSIFKNNWDADKQKQVSDQIVNTANKLGGAEATVYTSLDEVPDAYLSDVKNGATGWYDPTTHTVHVYLPNCADANEAERTVLHEKIGHEGMEVLLGGENEVRKFANFVYRSAGKDVRGKIIDFANKYDPDWKNNDRMNVGTQEYIAHLAEEGPKTAEDFSLWTKIKHYIIKVLKKLGIRVPGLLNDKDLRYYLMKAGKALHVWDEMPQEKQEAMMKQASNAEIKDALSDGAGKGKPRQKKGESAIQYMKRVMEWKRWKEAREDENDPEPPMFYDFDKDAEGKKEWERLNKEWRDSHHLQGDEMPIKPERKEGETDEAFFSRYKEWEKWNDAMADKENPMPDMFSFEKAKQDEARQKYEDWLTRHELNEQNDADLDLYEGKIYPAETNPEADALEQRVMQDLAEVTSTDVSKEGAAKTVKHAVIHRRKNMEEASADDAIYINDVKKRIEKMADIGAFDKLLSDYKGKKNRAEKLAETIPYIIEAPRRLRDMAHNLNATGVFEKGHIHIQPADVEAIQPYVTDLITETAKKHTEIKKGKEIEVYDDPQAVGEVASKMAQAINANHQGEEGFVPIDGTDILSKHVLKLVKQRVVPGRINYKELSPEMQAAIDSIRDWYNYTYDWLMDNHTLKEGTGYNVDYVNHIWDKEKSDPEAYATFVENRQRTKSPNEKPRTISTLMEGIYAGLVPKTTDITKMMAYYSRSNIEAWANKTMLQELTGLNVIERNEKGDVISTDPLLSSSAPFNLEQYKYFEIPGVGPVWVYNVSPKQVKVKNPITDNEKVIYSEASAGDRFGVVFETYQSSPFWKAFDTLASSAKKLELGFSGFHAGALTEVYMVQNMVEFGPKKAMANFMKYIFVDTAKNHELPCFANPQDFQEAATHLVKFGATNDYAAADVQNMFDNMRDAMMKVQEKLRAGNGISGTVALASMPLKVATQMLSLINKGMDRALWDFLHDGLKLATYRMRADKTKERAKKKGWTEEELSRALDEDGQFVNDMFGGQHWDILGASHRTLRYAGRVLLSPDWNASTTRHFLALTGYGSIWNEATFENFKQYYQRLRHQELMPEDEGRRSRQISALLCYGIGFMVFYEGIANGINAAFRAMDEEKERKKAEEIRKTNPSYKSMYELAYGDEGMKWYDYLMRGNSLGQQSKIYLGRYADGTEMYIRHGKQFREVPEYLFNHKGELEFPGPMVQRMIGKANPMVRMTLDDINYLSDFQASHADQEIQRKYGKTIGLLYKDALYWAPFLIPSQENKEFKAVDFFFPSSKGFSPWKAQSYFKDFILSGDMEGVVMTYQSCQRNGIDPEAQIKAAIGSVKALESAEMQDGVTSLQEASKRFDAAKSITEKKKMRQKMKKFLSQSDYKAFTQKEALDMVQGYLNGDEDLKEMEKAESKYLMKARAEDVTEDWRIQNVWNGTMETYQEYQRLKDVDKAKANAFKNSKTNKRLFAARKAISAAKKKMNKAKKQMDGQNDAAKLVEIRKIRKELLETLNGME